MGDVPSRESAIPSGAPGHPGDAAAWDRIRRLQAVTAALSEARLPADVARVVAHPMAAVIGADQGALAIPEPDGETLVLLDHAGLHESTTARLSRFPASSDLPLARAYRTGRPVWIGTRDQLVAEVPAIAQRPEVVTQAVACAPLVVGDARLGAIGFGFFAPRDLAAEERALVEDLATHAALALERARLYEREQHARRRLELLSNAARRLADAGLDLDAVLERVALELADLLDGGAAIQLLGPDDQLRNVVMHHPDPEAQALLRTLRPTPVPLGEGLGGRVAQTGSSVLIPRLDPAATAAQTIGPFRAFAERFPAYALICAPLRARGRVIGTVLASRIRDGAPFTADDLALVEDLADRAAVAIDNARLYAEAQAASRAREDVLSVVSHDLRAPLGAMTIAADALLRFDAADPATVRTRAQTIQRAADRMARLIDDLLDLAAIQAGRLSITPRAVAAADLVAATVELFGEAAAAGGLRLTAAVEEVAPLEADGERVVQALGNLVANALKVTPRGGEVELRAERGDREVVFVVRDTGPGIAHDDLPQIFDRFWRGGHAGYRGTGLGLAIARGLVEAHGGRIWAESAPGGGATFRFALPAGR